MAVGPEVILPQIGDVCFFAEDETRMLGLYNENKDGWTVMPEQSIYGVCDPDVAMALGLDFGDEGLEGMLSRHLGYAPATA